MQIKAALFALIISVAFVSPVAAGPFEDGLAAFERDDYATAVRLLRPLAEQGQAEAQNRLGEIYYWGGGVWRDRAEGVKWYRLAAESGHVNAAFSLGIISFDDEQAQANWYRIAAEGGHPDAAHRLGYRYHIGRGVSQDRSEAIKWYRKAADSGLTIYQHNLGGLYESGILVVQDYVEATMWFRKAAEQGRAEAQYDLGRMYAIGKGVIQDYVEAHAWFNIATAHGYDAAEARDLMAARLTKDQLATATKLAREYYELYGTARDIDYFSAR